MSIMATLKCNLTQQKNPSPKPIASAADRLSSPGRCAAVSPGAYVCPPAGPQFTPHRIGAAVGNCAVSLAKEANPLPLS